MREKYESLALADLKAIAKTRGIRGTSTMRKAELVDAMLAQDEIDKAAGRPVEVRSLAGTAVPYKRRSASDREASKAMETAEEKPEKTERTDLTENAGEAEKTARTRTAGEAEKTVRTRTAGEAGKTVRTRTTGEAGKTVRTRTVGEAEKTALTRGRQSSNASGQIMGRTNPGRAGTAAQRQENGMQNTVREGAAERHSPAVQQSRRPEFASAEARTESTGAYRTEQQKEEGPAERRIEGSSAEQRPAGVSAEQRPAGMPAIEVENCLSGLDSGVPAYGILEVMTDGFGFIRSENYLPGEHDVYVAPSQIRRFGLKTGDVLEGNTRVRSQQEKFSALLYVKSVNGYPPEAAARRSSFEKMTPVFPDERIRLELPGSPLAMRIMDLISPIGKGQRGMIVSPPKAGKTTLLKEVARSVKRNYPDMHLIILLIDERPEEVTDMKEAIEGSNVEVIYSTFDELPDRHKRVSEMVIERARRLVEHQKDVMILIDSITRLARAYNQVIPPSGRTLSGGLDPAALHMPKRFFGAARNMREGGSLTILATALVDTGSKMDDVVYEEFKGTGNMELVLDRKLSERRVFPAIDIPKSGTRREDLLLTREEMDAINIIRRALTGMKQEEATDRILDMFARTKSNAEFVYTVKKMKFF